MNNIRKYREKAGLTQKDLAEKLSITQTAVSHYETERRKTSFDVGLKILAILKEKKVKATLDDLFAVKQKSH